MPSTRARGGLSRSDAKAHIEQLKAEYSLEGHSKLAKVVSNALHILSSELYDESTHFIQELIQNADDNCYENPTPSLTLSYTPNRLRVDCNEIGFMADHIEAICMIRGSTKTGNDQQNYTGEKGIGFKSVFRVADVVWISSNNYQFKFDKKKQFGIIAPEWAEDFPVPTKQGFTTFFLELSPQGDAQELVEKLIQFNVDQLLFLRRLRQVEINVEKKDKNWSQQIRRLDKIDAAGNTITTLDLGSSQKRYMVRKSQVTDLPTETRRHYQTCSELVLAFPLPDGSTSPPTFEPKIFAGLPIGDAGGLQFLLQGDFILTASRLQLDTSLHWNLALRDAVPGAFLDSVVEFNSGSDRYIWPFFLPSNTRVSAFFKPVLKAIREALGSTKCLESMAGIMAKPSELLYVDLERFGDSSGKFLTINSKTSSLYLSNKYPAWTIEAIISLGVERFSAKDFLEHLRGLLSDEGSRFWTNSSSWHGDLAKVLLSLMKDSGTRENLLDLPIIPLAEGKWVSANSNPKPVFISEDLELADFPVNGGLPIIDTEASLHKDRRALYQAFGVSAIAKAEICDFICKEHVSPDFKPEQWTTTQLIAHARLLFETGRRSSNRSVDLWFATTDNKRCKGSSLYLREEFEKDSAAARIFNYLQMRQPIIHPDYLKIEEIKVFLRNIEDDSECSNHRSSSPWASLLYRWKSQEAVRSARSKKLLRWKSFLREELQLSSIPRLVTSTSCISEEFKSVLRHCPVSDWLQVVEDNWRTYSEWIEPSKVTTEESSESTNAIDLRSELKKLEVRTTRGLHSLSDTFLPDLDDLIEDAPVPTLNIQASIGESTRYRLSLLGVGTKRDARYYISCLKTMVDEASPDITILTYIYEQIQADYDASGTMVDDAFHKSRLIYVNEAAGKSKPLRGWFSIEQCSDHKINVEEEYPYCGLLFKCLMTTVRLNTSTLVGMATKINASTQRKDIMDIFADLDNVLGAMSVKKAANVVKPLLSLAVFPVVSRVNSRKHGLASPRNKTWFIADRQHLRDSFLGKLPLLDFTVQEIEKLENLFGALDLRSRGLSILVDSQCRPKGQLTFSASASWYFRVRAPFIKALIPPSHKKRNSWVKLIEKVRVSYAAEVSRQYTMKKDSISATGRSSEATIAHLVANDSMQIFITEGFSVSSQSAVTDVVEMISEQFEFKDPLVLRLLHILFGEKEHEPILQAFERHGFRVDDKNSRSCFYTPTELTTVPSPFKWSGFVDDWSHVSTTTQPLKLGLRFIPREGNSRRIENDRRLPILFFEEDEEWQEEDVFQPDQNLEYLGQRLVSSFFISTLGPSYRPQKHWTSQLRSRGGFDISNTAEEDFPFIIKDADASRKLTEFFISLGLPEAKRWQHTQLAYNFELAITEGGINDGFTWSWEQLERTRTLQRQYDGEGGVQRIMFMIQVCNIFKSPELRFVLNPWEEIWAGNTRVLEGSILKMAPLSPIEDGQNPYPTITMKTDDRLYQGAASQHEYPAARYTYHQHWTPIIAEYPGFDSGTTFLSHQPQPYQAPVQLPMFWHGYPHLMWPNFIPPMSNSYGGFYNAPLGLSNVPGNRSALSRPIPTPNWERLPRYTYRRLREKTEMRLLTLFPGKTEDLLRGVLQTCSFEEPIPYDAISYVWGESSQPKYKLFTPEGYLNIHAALFQVFQRIRKLDKPVVLWADAVCINQDDGQEKAQQVQLLPRIFQMSKRTYAFLRKDSQTDAAVEMLLQVVAHAELTGTENPKWPTWLPECPESWENTGMPPKDDSVWPKLAVLLDHEWFRRVWIVQEAVASPIVTFVCDDYIINWNDILYAMRYLEQERVLSGDLLTAFEPLRALDDLRAWDENQTRWSILLLLEMFRSARSTLKRDRFFALLGIASDGNLPGFEPDYTCPFEDVVRSFARGLVSQGMGVQLLYGAGLSSQAGRFPSWVPDWTIPKSPSLHESLSRGVTYRACGPDEKVQIVCQGADEIHVIGTNADKIAQISKSTNHMSSWRQYFAELDTMVDGLPYHAKVKENYKWKVPIAGANHAKVAISDSLDLFDSFKAFKKILKKIKYKKGFKLTDILKTISSDEPEVSKDMSLPQKSRSYMELLGGRLEGWRFVITEAKRCGIVPGNAQVGDEVLILGGGEVPFLFRKSSERTNAHQFIGECYIEGIMHGEVFEEDGDFTERIVHLNVY